MSNLPITLKNIFAENSSDANISLSYWFEDPKSNTRDEGAGIFVSLTGPEEFNGKTAAEFVWDSFREDFFYSDEPDCNVRLKRAVKSSQKRLQDLITNEDAVKEQGVDLHLAALAVCNEVVHLCLIGSPDVLLVRGGDIVDLSDLVPPYEGVGYRSRISVGRFDLKKEDILLISTPELLASFKDSLDVENWIGENNFHWSQLQKELDLFDDNLSGSQYIWVLGYDIPDSEKDLAAGLVVNENDSFSSDMSVDPDESLLPNVTENADDQDNPVVSNELDSESMSSVNNSDPSDEIEKKKFFIDFINKVKLIISRVFGKLRSFFGNGFISNIKLAPIFRSVGSKLDSMKIRGKSKKMFVRQTSFVHRKKSLLKYVVFISVLLGLSLYLVISQRNKVVQTQIEEDFNKIETTIDEASSIWKKDRFGAEGLANSAFVLIDDVDKDILNDDQKSKLEEYKDSAQSVLDEVNRVTALSESNGNIEIVFDSYLKVNESANITDIAYRDNYLYLVDEATHAIYKYSIDTGSIESLANSEDIFKQPRYLSFGEDRLFVYDVKEGIASMDMQSTGERQQFRIMPELAARNLGSVEEIGAFSDNIYILVKDEARVLKSYPAGSGYSYPEEYFRNGSFDKASDLLIDGNIYVLSNASEKIYKYYAGQLDNFELSGFNEPMGNPSCGVTGLSDTWPLYLFDSSNKRLISVEKASATNHPGLGVLTRQYEYRGDREEVFNDVKELVIDDDQQNLYILDGTRVLRVSLTHE